MNKTGKSAIKPRMAVEKLFWKDPYLTHCTAKVMSVENDMITLSHTVAYAFEGGQQSDIGTIGGFEILQARRDGFEIFYTIPENHTLCLGDSVEICIDWEKRYRVMKLHFAAELVLELVYQNYGHPEKIGANITYDKARVDFAWEGNISSTFNFLDAKLAEMIASDYKIICDFDDVENEHRFWQIEGFAQVPCGGTHIKSTKEIGGLTLKRVNPGKGKERIEIYLAD
nr:alanyl-tRNA editing protein [Seleniivibrio woodruffii]